MTLSKKIFFSAFALIVLLFCLTLLLRQTIVRSKVNAWCESFHQKTQGQMIVGNISFTGLRQIQFSQVNLLSPHSDTLFHADTIELRLSLWKMIRFKLPISSFTINDLSVNFVNTDSIKNYTFLLKKKKSENKDDSNTRATPASGIYQLWQKIISLSDYSFVINRSRLRLKNNKDERNFLIPVIENQHGNCIFELISTDHQKPEKWKTGIILNDNQDQIQAEITSLSGNGWLPFFDKDSFPKMAFHHIEFEIQRPLKNDTLFAVKAMVDSLNINYWRIADETVSFQKLALQTKLAFSNNTVISDTNTQITLNKIRCKAALNYTIKTEPACDIKLHFYETANDFFESLPKGIFYHFKNIKADGHISFQFAINLDLAQPDSLLLFSDLSGDDLKINYSGIENFTRINQTFLFDAYDGERFKRSLLIGPENPDFTPLNNISHFLQYAVLTSEDPSFFYHRGFIADAFRESMIENIKQKRFVRGGSTISMQLVKNVFLSREKTISRKLHEMLIVWLIENKHLVSKERMFEIYLNAIEWGPDIYGIKEAAQFYFNKKPAQLNLAESIFLAGIIPRPKYFKYSFDTQGNLKPFLSSYYRTISNRMLAKTWITPIDTFNLQPQIKLHGPALKYVIPADSLIPDPLEWNKAEEPF
jgi:hypothetical protein